MVRKRSSLQLLRKPSNLWKHPLLKYLRMNKCLRLMPLPLK